jgi:hypothetical protein
MTYRRTTTFTLHVVEEFHDDETPSLPGMPVVETTGDDITHVTRPLAKCGSATSERKRAGGGK